MPPAAAPAAAASPPHIATSAAPRCHATITMHVRHLAPPTRIDARHLLATKAETRCPEVECEARAHLLPLPPLPPLPPLNTVARGLQTNQVPHRMRPVVATFSSRRPGVPAHCCCVLTPTPTLQQRQVVLPPPAPCAAHCSVNRGQQRLVSGCAETPSAICGWRASASASAAACPVSSPHAALLHTSSPRAHLFILHSCQLWCDCRPCCSA